MSAEEILRESESAALSNNQIVSHVNGKKPKKSVGKKLGSLGAAGFITLVIIVLMVIFGSGNLIPAAISERLVEETDVQYADAVESKKLVFQQALQTGDVPENTAKLLKENGVEVGYTENGEFVEGNSNPGGLVLKMDGRIITASEFVSEVSTDVNLYNAFNLATYSRAGYYYDEAAKKTFERIGTTRNNYTEESDFDEVMERLVGKGSDIKINTVELVEEDDGGKYVEDGVSVSSGGDVDALVQAAASKNKSGSVVDSTLNSADALKVADAIAKEQKSSLFYLVFMENISKMKAGDGNTSKINEAMNYLYEDAESEVVDVKTGEVVKTTGTPMDSPSLYAILSGNEVEVAAVENYSSDRILKTAENQLGVSSGDNAISGTVASAAGKVRGSIGRLIQDGVEQASAAILDLVKPTVRSSLVDNQYSSIKGVKAGEFLVEGAVNTGKALAKNSGATPGDAAAVREYARLNSTVLAMDAAADRANRSPFDVSSRNTFLGRIVYDLAVSVRSGGSLMAGATAIVGAAGRAIATLTPGVYADQAEGYLTAFGDCETYGTIGAVGSAHCSEIATFDTSTLEDTFNDVGFVRFVEENTTLMNGVRTIKDGSDLARFILYNDERMTPLGVTDGGMLESLAENSGSVSMMANILEMVKRFLGASDGDRRIASGEAFVMSSSNADWGTYKYAQRYVSLARATAVLRQYAGERTAYNNIRYFEGGNNPVVAFLNNYYMVAGK